MSSGRRHRVLTPRGTLWLWLVPMAILGGIALLGFAAFYLFDFYTTGDVGQGAALRYATFDSHSIADALTGLAGMTAAVLGIVITVVSLLVQLTSERYTGVAQMFLRDRTNVVVMSYYVVTCCVGVFTSLSLQEAFVPRTTILVILAATVFGVIIMLPYFMYVFRFLAPTNLVFRIQREAVDDLVVAATETKDERLIVAGQAPAIAALEELTDITSNSISGKDKIIASRAVDAIKDFAIRYLEIKDKARPTWFRIGERIRDNPDFVAMDPESLTELEKEHTWLEWKALRQYLGIYAEAQGDMPDINYLIAIDTRYIGEAAFARKDFAVVHLAFRFMNSYLRAALNARAVRTAYNVLNQYRKLVESMIKGDAEDIAIEGVKHMIYYGRTSYDMQIGFVTETVAYDVSALCEFAHAHSKFDATASVVIAAGGALPTGGGPSDDALDDRMLDMFLQLDQPLRQKKQEAGLQGIRKAQIKLACYYLAAGAESRARKIAADMAGEDRDRLDAIRDQLSRVESKEFWEIIDRGRNFEYMPARQRAQMPRFFAMLG